MLFIEISNRMAVIIIAFRDICQRFMRYAFIALRGKKKK
ncbi:MAG: hypothetical protein ACJA1I_000537 [Zhongshania marina]|jgi:hypothetical protein